MILVGQRLKKIPGQLGLSVEIDKDRDIVIEPLQGGINVYINNGSRQTALQLTDEAVDALFEGVGAYLEARP